MTDFLTIFYGCVIGFSLGLTGGGGSIFAVPLLVYGLQAGVREAVGISLAAVGATALFGALIRLKNGDLDFKRGLFFALAGMAGAPFGTLAGGSLSAQFTLQAFAVLMAIVGWRMWVTTSQRKRVEVAPPAESGAFKIFSRPGWIFGLTGFGVGVLSGVFGVGGGFIIVPALTLVGGLGMHRAVATSLMVIALICVSGVASYFFSGDSIPTRLTAIFVGGGLLGMLGGNWCRSRINDVALKRVFAAFMWIVAAYIFFRK